MKHFSIFKLLFSIGFFCASLSGNAQVLNLDSIIRLVSAHPALQQYDQKINALNAYAQGAKSWEAPQIGAGLWMMPYNISQNPNIGQLMISAQQMIPNPSRQRAKEKYMLGMSASEEAMKGQEKRDLISAAKLKYNNWVILKKKMAVINESGEILKMVMQLAEISYKYNQEKLNETYKAQAQLYQLENMKLMLENEMELKRIGLNILMNKTKTNVFDIDTNYQILKYEIMEIDTAQLPQMRSDIKSLESSIKIAELKRNLELSSAKPEFGVRYDHMNSFGNQPNLFTVMGMIKIPIAPWSSKEYKASAAGINYEIAGMAKQREAIINEALGNIANLRSQIRSQKAQMDLYEKNIIPALRNNLRTTLLSYEHREENINMVMEAWQSLKVSRMEYLDKLGKLLELQVLYEREIEINN